MLFQLLSLITILAGNNLAPGQTNLPARAYASQQAGRLPLDANQSVKQEVLASKTASGPVRNPKMLGIKLTATAAIVIDRESGKILFAKNIHKQLAEASLTKIITAITVLDSGVKPDAITTISKAPLAIQPQGAHMRLAPGEKISLYNLLRGLLVSSANDAAIALGEYIAGSEEKFVNLMNQKARALGMAESQFKNPHGIDADGHYSSAYDLAKAMDYALDKKVFREIIGTKNVSFTTNVRPRFLKNSNKLLQNSYLNILGGKTGFTDNAGLCLIEVATNKQGHEIITVILNSKNEWQESKGLIDWTFRAYTWP